MFYFRNQRGFSLLELILYLGIFSIVAGLLFGILTTILGINQRESANAEVTNQLNFITQTIQRLVRESSHIELSEGVTTSTLRLRMKDSAKDPTIVYLNGTAVSLQQGVGSPEALTSNTVVVNALSFQKYIASDGHDTVSVDVTLTYNSANPRAQVTRTVTSAITRISASTFDSHLVPTSASLALGTSTAPWRKIFLANGDAVNPSYAFGEVGYDDSGFFKVGGASILGFDVDGVERMRIDGAGNIGVGTTTPSYMLDVNGAMRATSCIGCSSIWTLSGSNMYNVNSGNIGISTSTPSAKLTVANGAVLFSGSVGVTPVSGAGRRMMWIPTKAAFRVGEVTGAQWDDGNTNLYSIGLGYESYPRAASSTAIGYNSYTEGGIGGVAIGYSSYVRTSGRNGVSLGDSAAGGFYSTAIGYNAGTNASATSSLALLAGSTFGQNSFAVGDSVFADGNYSFIMGRGVSGPNLHNYATSSFMVGFGTSIPALFIPSPSVEGSVSKVAIGTATTTSATNVKFQVEGDATGADIYVNRAGSGLILKTADGLSCGRMTIEFATGAVTSTPIACP